MHCKQLLKNNNMVLSLLYFPDCKTELYCFLINSSLSVTSASSLFNHCSYSIQGCPLTGTLEWIPFAADELIILPSAYIYLPLD